MSSRAVRKRMGVVTSRSRRRRATVKPSMSGSMTSRTMRSGSAPSACAALRAPLPSAAVTTSNPAKRREEARRSRMFGSSSTTRSRASGAGVAASMPGIFPSYAVCYLNVRWSGDGGVRPWGKPGDIARQPGGGGVSRTSPGLGRPCAGTLVPPVPPGAAQVGHPRPPRGRAGLCALTARVAHRSGASTWGRRTRTLQIKARGSYSSSGIMRTRGSGMVKAWTLVSRS